MKILTLCGSIREGSSNHILLKAAHSLLPLSFEWSEFDIKDLPYFDPQLQFSENLPAVVATLRNRAKFADVLMIATPEYAHGIPGILKNALEWLVCEETMKKSVVVLIGAPSGGQYVKEYLLETLRTMDMQASEEKTFSAPNVKKQISVDGEILDSVFAEDFKNFLDKNIRK
jgi:NAD(P)H-dependent FMN reductase